MLPEQTHVVKYLEWRTTGQLPINSLSLICNNQSRDLMEPSVPDNMFEAAMRRLQPRAAEQYARNLSMQLVVFQIQDAKVRDERDRIWNKATQLVAIPDAARLA